MNFKMIHHSDSPELNGLALQLTDEMIRKGNVQVEPDQLSDFVVNMINLDAPIAFRRKVQKEMVVSVAYVSEHRSDLKSACYIALIQSTSNMLFCLVGKNPTIGYSITPEAGFVQFNFTAEQMFRYMHPVISAHFVLNNRISANLQLKTGEQVPEVDDLILFAKELKSMGVLPAPFPLADFLDPDTIAHLFRLYDIRGISYGNLSIRNTTCKWEGTSFWMTARGMDKSQLQGIGKDILLVNGFDEKTNEMLVSVPVEFDPRVRVSVDAIEHFMIYRDYPQVGAIVHVHAWMDDILCTDQAYPCGTKELAEHVSALFHQSANPEHTVIGLKNHGITVTGKDIREIFVRLRKDLKINVPMMT